MQCWWEGTRAGDEQRPREGEGAGDQRRLGEKQPGGPAGDPQASTAARPGAEPHSAGPAFAPDPPRPARASGASRELWATLEWGAASSANLCSAPVPVRLSHGFRTGKDSCPTKEEAASKAEKTPAPCILASKPHPDPPETLISSF